MFAARSDRLKGAFAALLVQGALAYLLVTGLRSGRPAETGDALEVFTVLPQPPPPVPPVPPPQPARPRLQAPEGAAAPANLRSRATEVTAPKVPELTPSPIVAAEKPNSGSDPTSGNADVPGPGTGSGGIGEGTGSGRGGLGPGGGGGGRGTPPRRIEGRLRDADYPRWAWEAGLGGTVTVIFAVEADGRVDDCRIVESSGSPDLDRYTCGLIEQRFRYRPSIDRRGRPVRSRIIESHSWVVEIEPPSRG